MLLDYLIMITLQDLCLKLSLLLQQNLIMVIIPLLLSLEWFQNMKLLEHLLPAATAAGFTSDIDSFTTVDVKYSYDLDMGGNDIKISAGINNVADEMAPLVYDAANFSYDPKHHDPRGRMVYLGIKVSK